MIIMKLHRMWIFLLLLALPLSGCGSDSSGDPCLQGHWVMPDAELDALIATVLPIPGANSPSGSIQLLFKGDTFRYYSDGVTIQIAYGGITMQASATFNHTGNFSARDGMLTTSSVTSSGQTLEWMASDGSEIAFAPGGDPYAFFSPPGEAPYTCEGNSLGIGSHLGADTPITLRFTRQ